mmetsp:Transcript_4578/g.9870  ORF Transcript_4578/g.9870 Transcript_4578/m.9870 type:complete len:348 (-) Transcript_4578:730-1773(-)
MSIVLVTFRSQICRRACTRRGQVRGPGPLMAGAPPPSLPSWPRSCSWQRPGAPRPSPAPRLPHFRGGASHRPGTCSTCQTAWQYTRRWSRHCRQQQAQQRQQGRAVRAAQHTRTSSSSSTPPHSTSPHTSSSRSMMRLSFRTTQDCTGLCCSCTRALSPCPGQGPSWVTCRPCPPTLMCLAARQGMRQAACLRAAAVVVLLQLLAVVGVAAGRRAASSIRLLHQQAAHQQQGRWHVLMHSILDAWLQATAVLLLLLLLLLPLAPQGRSPPGAAAGWAPLRLRRWRMGWWQVPGCWPMRTCCMWCIWPPEPGLERQLLRSCSCCPGRRLHSTTHMGRACRTPNSTSLL